MLIATNYSNKMSLDMRLIELLVEFRPVNPYVLGRFVIGYLRIKIGEFRLDKKGAGKKKGKP